MDSRYSVHPGFLERRTLAKQGEDVLQWFQQNYPKRQSLDRIQQLAILAKRCLDRVVSPADPEHPQLVQAVKDLQEFWFITYELNDRLLKPGYAERLDRSLRDAVLPDPKSNESPGRDAQFELLVAATCVRTGIDVSPQTGPGADLILTLPAGRCAVEAKRIKSFERMGDRVSSAADQFVTSQLRGIVVIDISMVIDASERVLPAAAPEEQMRRAQIERGEDFQDRHLPRMIDRMRGRPVGLLIIHDYALRSAGMDKATALPWGLISLWDMFPIHPPGTEQRRFFDEVWSLITVAMPQR